MDRLSRQKAPHNNANIVYYANQLNGLQKEKCVEQYNRPVCKHLGWVRDTRKLYHNLHRQQIQGTKLGLLQISFKYILACQAMMYRTRIIPLIRCCGLCQLDDCVDVTKLFIRPSIISTYNSTNKLTYTNTATYKKKQM